MNNLDYFNGLKEWSMFAKNEPFFLNFLENSLLFINELGYILYSLREDYLIKEEYVYIDYFEVKNKSIGNGTKLYNLFESYVLNNFKINKIYLYSISNSYKFWKKLGFEDYEIKNNKNFLFKKLK